METKRYRHKIANILFETIVNTDLPRIGEEPFSNFSSDDPGKPQVKNSIQKIFDLWNDPLSQEPNSRILSSDTVWARLNFFL